MAKHIYTIEPQKRIYMGDAGWIMCASGEAERFALVQLSIFKSGKKTIRTRRVIDSYADPAEAQRMLAHHLRKKQGRVR